MQMAFDGVPGALLQEGPDGSAEAVAARKELQRRNTDVGARNTETETLVFLLL